ncbi:hypothetical protein [Oenococcus oeni]
MGRLSSGSVVSFGVLQADPKAELKAASAMVKPLLGQPVKRKSSVVRA